MGDLRADKTYFPAFQQMVAAGELSEDNVRMLELNAAKVESDIDRLLENGEGELTEEDCDRIGTELPPGLYQHIRVTDDGQRPRVLGTFYLRIVDGVLDELWLARARKGLPPNPVDTLGEGLSFIPCLVGEPTRKPRVGREQKQATRILQDANGSQGVKGARPTLRVKLIESPDYDHRWQFPKLKVRSTVFAPVLAKFRDAGFRRVSLAQLRQAIEAYRVTPN